MRGKSAFLVSVIVAMVAGCGQPQIGPDKEAFKAVDALYSAVSLRDEKLLTQCETALNTLREAGKMPEKASSTLNGIIKEAHGGAWESAQTRLASFMEAQK